MPQIITAGDVKERIAGYSPPKAGKTRLYCSAMRGCPERFGERAIYIAADDGSESLGPVLMEDRERLIVIKPRPELDGPAIIGKNYDPLIEATTCATTNWREKYPDVGTIIWDTFTKTAQELLTSTALQERAPADSSDGRVTFGKKGTPSYNVSPSRSDYGATHNMVIHLLRHLFGQPLAVIVLFHQDWKEPKNAAEGTGIIGGPATVGKAQVEQISAMFQAVIRQEVRRKRDKDKGMVEEYVARTQPHGFWIAGVRAPGPPMPSVGLEQDPVNFWHAYNDALSGKELVSHG